MNPRIENDVPEQIIGVVVHELVLQSVYGTISARIVVTSLPLCLCVRPAVIVRLEVRFSIAIADVLVVGRQ